MKEQLKKIIEEAVRSEFSEIGIPNFEVDSPKDEQFGDYSSNVAMVLAKVLKRNPMEVAEELRSVILSGAKNLERSLLDPSRGAQDDMMIEKIEVVRPGYINFYLSPKYFSDLVSEINVKKSSFGDNKEIQKKTMVEYSQPNTHKEFHIGHLRNVFIGSTLVNILQKSGAEVIAANYIGDTGSHIAKCLWGIKKFHADENIDVIENKAEFLGKVYSEAVQAIGENPEYENEFKELQNKFEAGDTELVELWEKTKQWSMDEFQSIYKLLGVDFDVYFFESVEELAGKKMLPGLLEKGIAKESQGAIVADLEQYGLGVLVLARKDGSALYGLKDIPLAIKKFEEYKIDNSILVVDVRQSLYFQQLFKILELYGFKKEIHHVGFEFVALKGGESMSSRKGNVVPARVLIDEVTKTVKEKFPESPNPEAIGLGAIKFSMLRVSGKTKIEFDIQEALNLEGATAPYVQYAHARISSILRKADATSYKLQATSYKFEHPKEISLIRELNKFPELIEEISKSYEVHKLPHYAIKLADKFHSFYNDCRVIDESNLSQTAARLKLIEAVRIVLEETLRLIGVEAPTKM